MTILNILHRNIKILTMVDIRSMLVFSLFVATLVAVASMTQPVFHSDPSIVKRSLFEYVIGKYLVPQNCKVNFDWDEPQVVGNTVSFAAKFYQRNGRPYPICNKDSLLVEITQGSYKVATAMEIGGTDPNLANTARVKFTVRRSGEYRISVMVGNNHVKGSPFIKHFVSRPPDPSKTGFVNHCSTIVCAQSLFHHLLIEPRDDYNNLCTFANINEAVTGYNMIVTKAGEPEPTNSQATFNYDLETHRLTLQFCLTEEGCYRASITYRNEPLKTGDFNIIVLNAKEVDVVEKNVDKKSHNIWYEAKLLSVNEEKYSKAKKVYCYISPKQLTIKETIFKFFPKRLATFRLCPSTKFQFCDGDNQYEEPAFVVDDGCQPKVELMTPERNVIAATFTQFLLKNIGGSETFKDKQEFFYHEVRNVHKKRYHDKLPIKIQRDKLLESSSKATKSFTTADWCKSFEITFIGEQGLDWGGLRREWFEIVCSEIFDPENQLFMRFKDDKQSLVHPNPKRPAHLKLKHYEFAGKIVGKCLYESALGGLYRQLVKARFSRSFLAQLIGLRVHYKYFEQDDPDLYVSKIKYIIENDVEEMELTFTEEEYSDTGQLLKVEELVTNGARISVTNQNKLQYLDALAQYRLASSVKFEVEAFLKGLSDLIPDSLLSIFDENELELLMCGTGHYSIADFKANHTVSGSSYEFRKVLEWFWTAVSNFSEEEMARLLQFTTGCSQLPPAGFAELSPRYQITAAPTFGNLPTAHTCFNQLCLPDYDTYEQFEKALLLAVNEGTEGFGLGRRRILHKILKL
uniref:HECT-type E3 ubiquitin transferase n=1 Tax=Strigamia maritima TaxID=126957 RepID=T1IIH2_STRMM